MMQASKKIPFDNPDVLLGVRALYFLSNVVILALYFYAQAQINKNKGTSPIAIRLLILTAALYVILLKSCLMD
jgi:Phosphate transport (Pho88)